MYKSVHSFWILHCIQTTPVYTVETFRHYVRDTACDVCCDQRSRCTVSSSTARERNSLVVTAASLSVVDGVSSPLSGSGLEVSVPVVGAGSGVPMWGRRENYTCYYTMKNKTKHTILCIYTITKLDLLVAQDTSHDI